MIKNSKIKCGVAALGALFALSLTPQPSIAETKLRMVTSLPAAAFLYKDVLQVWADRVKESSGGELVIELFPAGTLGRDPATHLDMVREGVSEVGYIVPGYTPGAFPAATVMELPGVLPSSTVGGIAGAKLVEEGLIGGDLAGEIKILGVFTGSPAWLHTTKVKVQSLEDVKGLKLRGAGPTLLATIEAIGATPVGGITVTNLAESLSRGLVDGTVNEWVAATIFGPVETAKYHLDINLGSSPLMVIMNRSSYDKLPQNLKAAIDENSGEAFSKLWGEQFDAHAESFLAKARQDSDRTFTKLSDEEQARWQERLQTVIDRWIKETPNGKQVYDRYVEAVKEASESGK